MYVCMYVYLGAIFTGFLQPALLLRRIRKGDVDGFLDRHLLGMSSRKRVLFDDIGPRVQEGDDLENLFVAVYQKHHGEVCASFQGAL